MPHKNLEERRAYVQQWRNKKRGMGICIYCPGQARPGLDTCQRCHDRSRAYHLVHADAARQASDKYQQARDADGTCRGCGKPRHTKRLCKGCADKLAARGRTRYKRMRAAFLRHYGTTCKMCGEAAEEFLTVDHVDGWVEGPRGGHRLLDWIIKRGFPKGFQTLCWNCNCGRKEKKSCSPQKLEVMGHYGGAVCACCGETDSCCLTIDHVAGDGARHRRELGISSGSRTYDWLRFNGYPDGFQVLCYNCNGAKSKCGVCPHETNKAGISAGLRPGP